MSKDHLRRVAPYAWTSMMLASVAACGSSSHDWTEGAGEPVASKQQALSTDGQVCVTVQRGTSGQVSDATLWQAAPTWNDDDSERISTGTSPTGGYSRSLIRFDLGAVPAGATVLSANLALVQNYKNGPTATIDVLRANVPWSEGTVTWNSFGSSFEPAPAASFQAIGNGGSGPRTVDVRALVQAWVSGSSPNHGLVIDGPTDTTRSELRSSESPYVTERPALSVCYATCNDGVQNGEETGFDCGGPYCAPCNPDPGPPAGVPVEPVGTSLLVQVVAPDGSPVGGATVIIDGSEQSTDAEGQALFEGLAAGATVAQVRAAGFAPGTVSADLEAGVHGGATLTLMPLSPPVEFNADTDATIVADAVQLEIPAGSLLDEDGLPVTGVAEVAFAPIDPTTDDIEAGPGQLVGITGSGGEPVNLESGFMAEISLTQNGRPLQLAPGATATIQFTLPPAFAATVAEGELIQAWWFDHSVGAWREDGYGVVEASPTDPGTLIWTAEVSHFTSWNCDKPWDTQSCADVLVQDTNGNPLSGRTVTARGIDYTYWGSRITGTNGHACVPVKRFGSAQISVGPTWAPEAAVTLTPTANATCGTGGCESVTLTVTVPCGAPGTIQECAYTGPAGTAGVGACRAGFRICNGFTWGACAGQVTPSAEVCENSIDEDCDGQVNDGCGVCASGATQSCYTGPPSTLDFGACHAGTQTCVNGYWGPCAGEVTPTPEICGNGVDDDCDKLNNEGCTCTPGLTQACYQGPIGTSGVGQCSNGTRACYANAVGTGGFWGQCNGQVLPSNEGCDGADNDCDSQVDEGNPGGGVGCQTGQPGVCEQGLTACTGGSLVCNPFVGPSAEACDNLDNDCNGAVDDGNPGGGAACNTGNQGICAAGTTSCVSGVMACLQNTMPQPENCATADDDDCDGLANESCATQSGSFPYSASNTNSANQNTVNQSVLLPGGVTITVATCGLPGASANGDTYVRLYNPAGQMVAFDDDSCGNLATYFQYVVPAGAGGTYSIRAGCWSSTSCSGSVAYTF